jgi:hypothetical protein
MAKPPKTAALRVVSTSPMGPFRRAGYTFTAEPTVLPLADLSAEQVRAIKGTHWLDVTEVEIDPPAADKAADKATEKPPAS